MGDDLKNINKFTKKKENKLLETNILNVKKIRSNLYLELKENYSDKLLDKLIEIEKELTKAEKLLECTSNGDKYLFIDSIPKVNNLNTELNSKTILKFNNLVKKLKLK